MMKISHIGIAVNTVDSVLNFYKDALNLELLGKEFIPDQMVQATLLNLEGSRIELLEATDPKSPVAKFLDKKGQGIHHICLEVADLEKTLFQLKSQGIILIDEVPRIGADNCLIAFIHPKSTGGVLIELSQHLKTASGGIV